MNHQISPISEMIADMVKQTNDIRFGKTQAVINKLVDLKECHGCNGHFPEEELTVKTYLKPFSPGTMSGYFCKTCENDPKIKTLFL